ncbi:PKD domain-containing protein [Saccharicrinis sp. GN24d3]|uniref:PKD domain-containing protein n=1 Tax=Saccharicrinis sp. GN24d3 TaxID=3458416 RepID=UPI00403657D5
MDTNYKNIRLLLMGIILFLGISSNAQTLNFSIENLSIEERDTFVVAIRADSDLTGEDVFAYRFHITYHTSYFEFLEVESVGSMLPGWGLPEVNLTSAGNLRLAGAGADAMVGTGDMIYLKFRSLRYGGAYIGFNASQSYLNEGSPTAAYTSGLINASQRSFPNITPDSGQLFVGDEIGISASGGLAPYVFDTENSAVVQIIDNNTLRGVGPGVTRTFVTDANAEINYSTGVFDVRAIRMSFQSGISVFPTQTVLLPILIEVAPGTQVYSGTVEISYSGGLVPSEAALQQGDYSLSFEKRMTDRLAISFASGTPVTGSGVLVYVPMLGITPGNKSITYTSTVFNENLLSFNTNNNLLVNTLPNIAIAPNSGSLMWGGTINLSVSNGTPPYNFTVSDNNVASVDASGVFTGLSGGQVAVSVTDNIGASTTSGVFTVNDHTLTINNTDGDLDSDTRVAVSSSQLPAGRNIFSFEGTITYQSAYLDFVGVEGADPGMLIETTMAANAVNLAGASTSPISSGNLFYLLFRIKNDLNILSNTPVSFNGFSFNEGNINSVLANGVVTRVAQATYRPVADAGANFSVNENSTVQLDGSGSYDNDGDPFTYEWGAPQGITLDDPNIVNPSFLAPEVNQNTNYQFSLVTNDGTSNSDTSWVTVTILQVNKAPVANAGPDMSYPEGTNVVLDGTGSTDADGQTLIYSWQSLDGTVLFNPSSSNPSFIAPEVQSNTTYQFELTVNDGIVDSEADTVHILVQHVNKIPIAHAGVNQSVNEGDPVQLDGSLSADPDNEDITYLWTAPAQVTLSSNTVAQPTFTAPSVRLDSALAFSLVVNDGQSNSIPDEVIISVLNTDVLSDEADILDVTLTDMLSADIDAVAATVSLNMPYGYDIRSLSPGFELSTWATVNPPNGSNRDFSVPQIYVVTAENGTTSKTWTVGVTVPETTLSRSIAAGWNMLSLSLTPNNVAINDVMSSLTFENLDYLKSPVASTTYYAGFGWFGDLNEFPAYLTVRLKKATAGTWQVAGSEINPTLESIPVVSGWNSLPYLLNADAAINDAILSSSIPSGDILIKGEAGAAIYFPGTGWVGDLNTMEVLHGYKINMQYPGVLRYDASAVGGAVPPSAQMKKAVASNDFGNDFRYSANLVGEFVDMDKKPITNVNDQLRAYNNGVLCGVATATYVSDLGRHIFVLTYYANNNGETIEFKSVREGHEADMFISRDFVKDDIIGSASNPEQLVLPITTGTKGHGQGGSIRISPNPASGYLNINSEEEILLVSVYNSIGNKVMNQEGLGRDILLNIELLPTGIYYIEITVTNGVYLHKFIKNSK